MDISKAKEIISALAEGIDPTTGEVLPELPLCERLAVMKREIELMLEYKNERTAFMEARKHVAWYMYSLKGAAALRRMCGEIKNINDIDEICKTALEWNR